MSAISLASVRALDAEDELAPLRERFALPEGVVYLDGNSLGPLPRATVPRLVEVAQREWGEGLIRSWNDAGWIDLADRVAAKIGRIVGAAPGSVAVGDSTSVNLFKLLGAALALRPERRVVLTEAGNFPTDLYVAQGLAALLGRGHEVRAVPRAALRATIDEEVAVVMVTQVDFRTGAMHDLGTLTRAAQDRGAVMLWDLAHSLGAVPVDLASCGAEFAVGCGYKFLNGGPGAPAFLYVRPDLIDRLALPLQGWLGHAAPFAFEPEFRPAPGIKRVTVGTPPILSLAALDVGVDIVLAADSHALRRKSKRLGSVLEALVAQECPGCFRLASPADPEARGSQLSFAHPEAYAIVQALIARGIVGDFRAPDLMRLGLAPLYLRFEDVWTAVATLREVMAAGAWRSAAYAQRRAVT